MQDDLGTVNGRAVDDQLLNEYSRTFKRDWEENEVLFERTAYSQALAALQALNISAAQIEALERKALRNNQPFDIFVKQIIRNELLSA